VRVTNLRNSRSMIVRVNDRGPFHGRRLIDLSQKAAELLGFKNAGTAPVKVEYMGRASLKGSDDRKLMSTLMEPFAHTSSGRYEPVKLAESSQSENKAQYASLTTSFKESTRAKANTSNSRERAVPALRASIDPSSQAEMAALARSVSKEEKNISRVLSQNLRLDILPVARSSRKH
jgi:rare lipoprotein A